MGGGFELALACDIIVASERAIFALPEPRVGLAALAGGLVRLPRIIGQKRAMGMILTARRVGAAEGLDLGFVNEVVPHEELLPAARRWADQILECSPMSIRASKEVFYAAPDAPDLETAIAGDYPGGAGDAGERGLHRGSARVRREARSRMEGPLRWRRQREPDRQAAGPLSSSGPGPA